MLLYQSSCSLKAPNKLVETHLKQLVGNTGAALVLDRREGVLDHCKVIPMSAIFPLAPLTGLIFPSLPTQRTVFDPEVDVDLVQDVAHAHGGGVGQQDEAQVGRGLVVVHAVLAGAVGDEGVVLAAKLADHVAQAEDGAEDELGVVLGARALGLRGCCCRCC